MNSNEVPEYSAESIAKIRKNLGWSQEECAVRCGVRQCTWSKWETGFNKPDLRSRMLIQDLEKKSLRKGSHGESERTER